VVEQRSTKPKGGWFNSSQSPSDIANTCPPALPALQTLALRYPCPMPNPLWRQGDLLIAQVDAIPAEASLLDHLVLAEGEATGHQHKIAERNMARLYGLKKDLYLEVFGDHASLIHDEHKPIILKQGNYHIWRQREFIDDQIRAVVD
jgi:hypothetical protein